MAAPAKRQMRVPNKQSPRRPQSSDPPMASFQADVNIVCTGTCNEAADWQPPVGPELVDDRTDGGANEDSNDAIALFGAGKDEGEISEIKKN